MGDKIINLYKRIGETPLERLRRFRIEDLKFSEAKLSYAGRLDPLAEGVLPILVGASNKSQDKYFRLDKEYEIEVLIGFETDSYDLLGLSLRNESDYDLSKLKEILSSLVGKREEEYPAYSSKNVLGKPLFYYARNNKLSDILIPKREIEIFEIDLLGAKLINKDELTKEIIERISRVNGDFRQEEILEAWTRELTNHKLKDFDIVKLKVSCGEGAYMRTLALKIGKLLGTSALAFSIKRTRVGEMRIEDSIK